MIAYFFRFAPDGKPNGWFGFAVASDQDSMFWQIDQHGDPYAVEIQTTNSFSWCALWNPDEDAYEEHEIPDCPLIAQDNRWRKPSWVREQEEARKAKPKPEPEKFGHDPSAPF